MTHVFSRKAPGNNRPRAIALWSSIGAAFLLGLLGCASAAEERSIHGPLQVIPLTGYVLNPPAVSETARGMRFRGSICNVSGNRQPTIVRVEVVDGNGAVTGFATGRIDQINTQGRRCTFFTVQTDWRADAVGLVRLCAAHPGDVCRPDDRRGKP